MNGWSCRIKRTQALINWLDKNAVVKQQLTAIEDRYFKPINISLEKFSPQKKALRIRIFWERKKTQLAFLQFFYKQRTYSHSRYVFFEGPLEEAENIVSDLGFEEWGRQKIQCFEYIIDYKNKKLTVLDECLDGKKCYLKIETSEEKTIIEFLKKIKIFPKKSLRKNMIWLLALEKKLIFE